MSQEKRALRRIDNQFGTEFKAVILINGLAIEAKVRNYNSIGISLDLSSTTHLQNQNYLDNLQVFYGSEKICDIDQPKIVRIDQTSKTAIVSLREVKKISTRVRSERASLSFIVQGSVFGTDPYTLDQLLMFRISNISSHGFRLISSKSNRHLTPGLELKDFNFMIPGSGVYKISFKIMNVEDNSGHLRFGCKFTKTSRDFETALEKVILTSTTVALPEDGIDQSFKSKVLSVKKFGNKIRVRRVTNGSDFEKILKIRYKAYKEAHKVKDSQTWKDMRDQYDPSSIIYTAYIGSILAGTIRLVFRPEGTKLPFEEYLDPQLIKDFDVTQAAEVSRFAIDPHFQGTDLFLAMFRKIIFEIGAKGIKYPVCMATDKLGPYYMAIGAKKLSNPIPHPTIEGENLTLLLFPPDAVIDSKMSALGWFFVAKPALRLLRKFKFVRKPSWGLTQYIAVVWEIASFVFKKKLKKHKK